MPSNRAGAVPETVLGPEACPPPLQFRIVFEGDTTISSQLLEETATLLREGGYVQVTGDIDIYESTLRVFESAKSIVGRGGLSVLEKPETPMG